LGGSAGDQELVAELKERIAQDPGDHEAICDLAEVVCRLGNTQWASKLSSRAAGIAPDDPHVMSVYAAMLSADGQHTSALTVVQATMEKHPNDARCAYEHAIIIWQHFGKREEAKEGLLRCLRLDAYFIAAKSALAQLYKEETDGGGEHAAAGGGIVC